MTVLLIALSVAAMRMVTAFTGEKSSYLYKEVLHLSAGDVATLGIIMGIPGYLRPFMGAGADLFPLFGFHRRSYYVLSWLLMAASYFGLAHLQHYHYATVLLLGLIAVAGGNLLMVIVDAVMVAVGNRTGTVGRMQSVQQGVQLVMTALFAAQLGGYVTQHWSYAHCFDAGALVCVISAIFVAALPETRVLKGPRPQETEEEHRQRQASKAAERAEVARTLKDAARTPGLWAMVGFVFYLIVTPGTNTAQFYYMNDVLHYSKQFIGSIGQPGAIGAIIGILLFLVTSRRLPIRAMVWGAYLMDCSIYISLMFLHSHKSAIVITFIGGLIGIVYNLCLFTLAARACPPKIEGTVYGLVMAAIALAGSLGEKLGSSMYDHFGPATHHTIAYGWHSLLWFGFAFTIAAVVFIPFLPAWAKSNEPLHAQNGNGESVSSV
jgi:MFS family permease